MQMWRVKGARSSKAGWKVEQTYGRTKADHCSHLFLWLQLHWPSTSLQRHLLGDHQGWVHLVTPGLRAALYESAELATIYLTK